jgi:hypothetical protein
MKSWNVINPDNETSIWYETQRDRLLHRFPLPDENGFIWLKTSGKDALPYVVDDARCIREQYHDRRTAGIVFLIGAIFSLIIGFLFISAGILIFVISFAVSAWIGAPLKEDRHYYWRENEPDQIIFDEKLTPGSVGITGKTIATYAKSEHLKRLVAPETNWVLIAVICVLVGIMAGAIGYSVGINQGGVHP